MTSRNLLFSFVLIIAFHTANYAQKLSGKVTNNGTPIASANITAAPTAKGTAADDTGLYTLMLTPGNYTITFSATGFEKQTINVTLAVGENKILNANLLVSSETIKDVVVVGSRGAGRVKTESPVPIDVVRVNQIGETSAKPDLSSLLNMSVPSFNYNKQSGADGSDAIDLATLRGLGPDQTLVLINGKRQHQTAFVALFGTRGRGNSGTDLNAIPEASIDRVEILRDGASAQYGSDAMAGVINIILKKDVKHVSLNVGASGYYDHKYNALNTDDPSQYYTGNRLDGITGTVALNYGLPIGKQGGYINFSGNYLGQGKTLRQEPYNDPTKNAEALPINTNRRAFGDASLTTVGGMYNSEIPIAGTKTTFYSFGGYNHKNSNAYAYSRNFSARPDRFPTDASGNLIRTAFMHKSSDGETYYNPIENVNISDVSVAFGFKGSTKGNWDWDISNTLGNNDFHFYGEKTFNASLGAAGANRNNFDDGGFSFFQNTVNADISKHFASIAQGLNLAFGTEYRYEKYNIYAGEEASWKTYDQTKAGGSQGFPGFQPADVPPKGNANRSNLAAYVDAEIDITKEWLVDGAVRFENYNDFGFLSTFKLASRYKVSSNFNLRGSVSTGFRAPSLAQINFSNTFTTAEGGKIAEQKIAPNYSPIAQLAGIPNLKQETSFNASLGFSWKPVNGLTLTIDGYMVKIKDRVVLSGQFDTTNATLKPYLKANNISNIQFFANAVNTTNTGLDVVIDYNKKWGKNSFKALFAGNIQHMIIDKINVPAAFNKNDADRQQFYTVREQEFILASAPPIKLAISLEYGFKKMSVGTHFTYYGKIQLQGYSGTVPTDATINLTNTAQQVMLPEEFIFHGKMVSDLYFGYKCNKKIGLSWGIDNIFNVHPDLAVVQNARLSAFDTESGGAWESVQMGLNGMRFFTKLAFNF